MPDAFIIDEDNVVIISQWTDPRDTEVNTAWARETPPARGLVLRRVARQSVEAAPVVVPGRVPVAPPAPGQLFLEPL